MRRNRLAGAAIVLAFCSVVSAQWPGVSQQCIPGGNCGPGARQRRSPNYDGRTWRTAPNSPSGRLIVRAPIRSPPAKPDAGHETIVRIAIQEPRTIAYGSGTIVDVRQGQASILTCSHLFMDRKPDGKITVLVNGKAYGAVLVDSDAVWELALLKIPDPGVRRVLLTETTPKMGEKFFLSGFGPGAYRQVSGQLVAFTAPVVPGKKEMPFDFAEFSCAVREGDSGGPILDTRGRLAGVVWGKLAATSHGICFPRIRNFLRGSLPKQPGGGLAPPFKAPQQEETPAPQAPPVVKITPPSGPPAEINYERLAGLVFARIEANAEKFRGLPGEPGATGSPGKAGAAGQRGARGLAGIAGEVAGGGLLGKSISTALTALGWTAPPSMAVLGGLWLLRWWLKRRRSSPSPAQAPAQAAAPVQTGRPVTIHDDARPPPARVVRDRQFVDVEVPSRQLVALQQAMDEYVRRHPGARGVVETIEGYARQFECGLEDTN